MQFKNVGDLVNQVNTALGPFCDSFGVVRKELAGLGKVPKRGILFKYEDVTRSWAINEGGGTELQYHIAFDESIMEVIYGLGFNTEYVPFSNEMSMVDYMQPFMEGFLQNENTLTVLMPDYDFRINGKALLVKPEHNKYVLWGDRKFVTKLNDQYIIDDTDFDNIIKDLKQQLEVYKIIFNHKNHFKKVAMDIQHILSVLTLKGQIILQGPPGTGKTYMAKDLAEQKLFSNISADKKEQAYRLEKTDQFELIQFHPAYSYEDFVRGIVAKTKGDFIEYVTENKILARIALAAQTNYLNSQKPSTFLSKQKWLQQQLQLFSENIQEKIDEEGLYALTPNVSIVNVDNDAFRYKGKGSWSVQGNRMLFIDIIQAYLDDNKDRQEIKNNTNLSRLAYHHSSYYIKVLDAFKEFLSKNNFQFNNVNEINEAAKPYVLIIDEINRANLPAVLGELIYALEYRGEKVKSMYAINEDSNLTIPPNLFIIGTMNTSDRSIGNIDYAIRRRFAFIDVLPKIIDIPNFQTDVFRTVTSLFIKNFDDYQKNPDVKLITSEHLSEEFRPEDVWLGHSYFIKGEGDFDLKKKYEIIPILKEYIKDGILKQTAESIIINL